MHALSFNGLRGESVAHSIQPVTLMSPGVRLGEGGRGGAVHSIQSIILMSGRGEGRGREWIEECDVGVVFGDAMK